MSKSSAPGFMAPMLTQATSLAKSALSGFAWAATLLVTRVCFASSLATSAWRDWQYELIEAYLPTLPKDRTQREAGP
jgi:hypothetical protein